MAYWKSLEQRCLEAAALDGNENLSNASAILSPVQMGQLIGWMAAHDCFVNSKSVRFKGSVRGLLCDEIRALDLDVGKCQGQFLKALAEKCGATLEFLRIKCGYKVYEKEFPILMSSLGNIRSLDLREVQIKRNSGVLNRLQSPGLERVALHLFVPNSKWKELEIFVERNPTIKSFCCNIRGRLIRDETALLQKIAERLNSNLVELELLRGFTATNEALNQLLISCDQLKKLRLAGRLQFDVATMVEVQAKCEWEVLKFNFEETPSKETCEALQHVPTTLLEVALDFGRFPQTPQDNANVVNLFASLPDLKRIRYRSVSFDDVWMISLLSALPTNVARGLDCAVF